MTHDERRLVGLSLHYSNQRRYARCLSKALEKIEKACKKDDLKAIRKEVVAALATPRPPNPISFPEGEIVSFQPLPEYLGDFLDLPGDTTYIDPNKLEESFFQLPE